MAIKKDSPSPKNQDFSGVWKSMKKERSTPRASSRHCIFFFFPTSIEN